jgi:hypothetical protein
MLRLLIRHKLKTKVHLVGPTILILNVIFFYKLYAAILSCKCKRKKERGYVTHDIFKQLYPRHISKTFTHLTFIPSSQNVLRNVLMARVANTKETPISLLVWNQQRVLQEYLDYVTLQELSLGHFLWCN